ncbi:hypothetical protein H7J71_02140 [Mycolicibacterium peregrinum]|uniref:hypothetical protein n=1 Tax=Mycolicibacterium peregrinum TaxID=43304 RepID=UPI0006D82AF6|nr:hypothetical protein [Mycolicibacterium peregrinum]MCV7200811.1 hypothetical protein [Mycolicibacterium peregrinum]ORW49759.1 hypothetical protein AWC21_01655 [Mycolicibacterium peregrinum]
MSERIETVIAEALNDVAERYLYIEGPSHPAVSEFLAALKAARIAVVELPEPVLSPRHQERIWEVEDSHVIFSEKWRTIRAELDYDNGDDDPLPASDARAFAAALIAAADDVEAERSNQRQSSS